MRVLNVFVSLLLLMLAHAPLLLLSKGGADIWLGAKAVPFVMSQRGGVQFWTGRIFLFLGNSLKGWRHRLL